MPGRLHPDTRMQQHILENGCYNREENRRIYDKWFARGPRHQFQAVNAKYQLTEKAICDLGCGYGVNLVYCRPGSYGIEVDKYSADFARSIGLTVYERDFMRDSVDDLPAVDAVWCSAVIEHVESVHIFLRKMALILKPGGLLAVYVPTIPLIPALRYLPVLGRYTTGYLHSDHINAFTPATLRFFCERSGFETLELSPFMPGLLSVFNHVPLLHQLVSGCAYVGRKIDGWDYAGNATRQAVAHGIGFTYRRKTPDDP